MEDLHSPEEAMNALKEEMIRELAEIVSSHSPINEIIYESTEAIT